MIENVPMNDRWDASEYRVETEVDDSTIINLNLYYQGVFVDTILSHKDEDVLLKFKQILNQIVHQNNIEHYTKDLSHESEMISAQHRVEELQDTEPRIHNHLYRRA